MFFNFNFEQKPLPQYLLSNLLKDNIFENYLTNLHNFDINFSVEDLSKMIQLNIDVYDKDYKDKELTWLNAHKILKEITDNVFKIEVDCELSALELYNQYLKKIYTINNLYGILGKDEKTGEIINFTHPFRAILLIKNNPRLQIGNLYIYKKIDNLFTDKTTDKEKLTIKTFVELYCACYKKGLKSFEIQQNEQYLSFYQLEEDDYHIFNRLNIFIKTNKNKQSKNSFLYYSDLLQYDSFMPHFSMFNLKKENTRLIGTFLKYCPCLSPNISLYGNVCTGRLKNLSKEGVECLKISNLSSPYHSNLFCSKTYDFYHKYCLVASKKIYEGTL